MLKKAINSILGVVVWLQSVMFQFCTGSRPPSYLDEGRGAGGGDVDVTIPRKTLVLDLDETLIHTLTQKYIGSNRCDLKLDLEIEGNEYQFYVNFRPYAFQFIDTVAQWYDLVVFTASLEAYGAPVIEALDRGKGLFKQQYFRESCTYDRGMYMKDLTIIDGDLANILIIDNSASAYELQPANAVPIVSWFDDPLDEELLDLIPFLDALRCTKDVRSVLSLRA